MVAYATHAAARQPQLLDPQRSTPEPLSQWNGRLISQSEACRLLGCDGVEAVAVTAELVFVLDKARKDRLPRVQNLAATAFWYQHQPAARGIDCICGRAILCHVTQVLLAITRL